MALFVFTSLFMESNNCLSELYVILNYGPKVQETTTVPAHSLDHLVQWSDERKWSDGRTGPVAGRSNRWTGTVPP